MKSHYLSIALLLFIVACGKQESLELDKDQVFSKQFSAEALLLANDKGQDVTIRPMRVGSSSARGFTSQQYYGDCTSLYGCQSNPYSQWLGYSNNAHAWQPSISRTVNLNFGARNLGFQQQGNGYCVNLNITSNRTLEVLRSPGIGGQQYGQQNPQQYPQQQNYVSGSGSNTLRVQARTQYIGQIVFAVKDQQALQQYCPNQYGNGWQQQNWWDFSYNQPSCSAPMGQATLEITGTAGPCGSATAVTIKLTDKLNTQAGFDQNNWWSQGQRMPYFSSPDGNIWGRVLQYSGGQGGVSFWGM